MNWRSVGLRKSEMFVSKAMRSLFSSRIVGEAAVGWFMRRCHQLMLVLGVGVVGSELRIVGGLGPYIVLASMWIRPHRMSMCKAKSALVARAWSDSRVWSNAVAVSRLSGR